MRWMLTALLAVAAGAASAGPAKDADSIRETYRRIEAAYERRDAAALMAFTAPDMTATGPGGERLTRRDLARILGEQMLTLRRIPRATMDVQRLTVRGDLATATVAYRLEGETEDATGRPHRIVETGVSIETWRRGKGGWRLVRTVQQPVAGREPPVARRPPPATVIPGSARAAAPVSGRRAAQPSAAPGVAPVR